MAGALWLVEEGGLEPPLSRAVWAGFRRPRGIWWRSRWRRTAAAPGGDAGGLRVSRIAVHPARQREGLGQRLIAGRRRLRTGIISRSVLAIRLSCGASGNAAVLRWCGWAPIGGQQRLLHRDGSYPLSEAGHRWQESSGCSAMNSGCASGEMNLCRCRR
jgi:tRNA(Met) cytidine acetyltransferase